MTIPLPQPIPSASGWQFSDWRPIKATSGPASSAGVATITLDPVPDTEQWLLDRAIVQCTGVAGPLARVYEGNVNATSLLDGSNTGRFDVAEWPNGLLVRPSTSLVIQWTGCDVGAVATFRAQARVYVRS